MSYQARLKKEYNERIISGLKEEFGYKNFMEVPKLQKIVLSRGIGSAVADKKLIDYAVEEALTTYGLIGVKVWICKGEVYGKRSLTPIETIVVGTKRGGQRKKNR